MTSEIQERYFLLKEEIGQINPEAKLVAVTKGQPLEKIQSLADLPTVHLANNYAQEGESLQREFENSKQIVWHFIGHIQSRKVKFLVHYDWIQSLDRLEIAEKLDRLLSESNRQANVLIEINIGNEPQKSGISPLDLPPFIKSCAHFKNLKIRGLMAMPPPVAVEERRQFFKATKELFDRYSDNHWDTLSMGTSEDYRIALEEGSTMVRLGSVLFGPRPKK